MNSKLKTLMTLVLVVLVIFTTQVSADLATSQAAYDEVANVYSLQNHNYNGAVLKFNAVVASNDIAQVISLQQKFDVITVSASHNANYCLDYNNQLKNSADAQEQLIADKFLTLSQSFSTLNDKAMDKVNYLEHVKNNLKNQEIAKLDADLGGYTDEFKTLNTQYQDAQCNNNTVDTAAKKLQLNDLFVKVTEDMTLAQTRATDLQSIGEVDLSGYYNHYAVKFATLKHDLQFAIEANCGEKKDQLPIDNSTNTAPVFTVMNNKNVTVGATVSFTVSATDANNDSLIFTVENKPASATFNNKVFSWTPVASDVGTQTVTFKVVDGKGGEAKANVVITVSQSTPLTPLQEKQNEFNGFENDYQTYADDYYTAKKKYELAVKNKDNVNIKKYSNELTSLDKELKSLNSDLKSLKDDVDNINGGDNLYDDTKDLIKSVDTLRSKIADTLNYAVKAEETSQVNVVNAKPTTVDKPVEVQFLNGMPAQTETPRGEVVVQEGQDLPTMALLIGGIVVLMAVIVFLLAVVLI